MVFFRNFFCKMSAVSHFGRTLVFIILFVLAISPGAQGQYSEPKHRNFASIEYQLNYPWDLPRKKSYYYAEHHFYLSITLGNRLRPHFFYAVPHNVFLGRRPLKSDFGWGLGFEIILNRKNKKFFVSIGPEFSYQRKFFINYGEQFFITLVTKLSYRINNKITLIAEPFSLGTLKSKIFYPGVTFRETWNLFPRRMLSLGASVNF